MPANVAALYDLEVQSQYERDGLSRVIPLLKNAVGAGFENAGNVLVVTRLNATNVAAGGEVAAWTNAAVRLYAVHIAMPTGTTASAHVQIFNTSTASVTLGTTRPHYHITMGGTTARSKTVVFLPGNEDDTLGAMSYAVSTTAAGATGVNSTNTPVVTFLTQV